MAKEIIYIESNDDITTIINKIKDSKENIVALVPPKQIGILQSAVNLELIARSAKNSKKLLVIVTNNQALIRLAGLTKIPIAKSFKSKPELVDVPAIKVDGEDDIIDGAELPIAEFAQTEAAESVKTSSKNSKNNKSKESTELKPAKIKVPNYNKFRKRLIIGVFLSIALIGFLVWALIFAPTAEITLKTRTKNKAVSETVELVSDSAKQDIGKNMILAQSQVLTKKKIIEFVATGEKEVGNPAVGSVTLTRALGGAVSVPSGSGFSRGDCTFVTQKDVVVPGASVEVGGLDIVPGTMTVEVAATVLGEQCNIEAGALESSINGLSATGTAMTGGTKKRVKVVTGDDIHKAQKAFNNLSNDNHLKELRNKFDSSVLIMDDSLETNKGKMYLPEVGQVIENGKTKIEQEVKYTLYGIAKKDLNQLIETTVIKDKKELKVYQSDDQKISFIDYVKNNKQTKVRIVTKAVVGPLLDQNKIKQFVAGKVTGQIKDRYESIEGVDKVEVKYYPFWNRTVPNNLDKITVEIDLLN